MWFFLTEKKKKNKEQWKARGEAAVQKVSGGHKDKERIDEIKTGTTADGKVKKSEEARK